MIKNQVPICVGGEGVIKHLLLLFFVKVDITEKNLNIAQM